MPDLKGLLSLLKTDRRAQLVALLIVGLIIYLIYKRTMTVPQRIKSTAKKGGMPVNMQELLLAQAKHETGNFTSNAFKEDNNLYGYKCADGAVLQLTCGIKSSEGNPYARYAKIEDSVMEICNWIKRRQKSGVFPADLSSLTAETYAQLLKNAGYYGDSVATYSQGLKHYLVS